MSAGSGGGMSSPHGLYSDDPPALPAGGVVSDCRRYAGRTALITGGARGIGFATALRLAGEGATVWVTDRDAKALERAREVARGAGFGIHALTMDSADQSSIQASVKTVLDQAGAVHVLVNNAGGSLHTPYAFMEEEASHWERVTSLNVMSVVWACQAVLPAMRAQSYGRIVNFGSKAGRYGSLIAGANYAAAKGAVAALTRQMAMEFGPDGITVNCICPGVVMTDRTERLWSERRTEQERQAVLGQIPLRRHCTPEDVAASVAFLGSGDASFITGVTLDLNGGQAMS